MMGRRHLRNTIILVLVGVISVTLLQLQLQTQANHYTNSDHQLFLKDVRTLLSAGQKDGVTLILLEPTVLQAWSQRGGGQEAEGGTKCAFLCHSPGPLTFAVHAHHLNDKPKFLTRLVELGLEWTKFKTGGHVSHVFLVRKGSLFHLTVLHPRPAGYLRQYALEAPVATVAQLMPHFSREAWDDLSSHLAYNLFNTTNVMMDELDVIIPSDIPTFLTNHRSSRFIPCNTTQTDLYHRQHPHHNNLKQKEFKRDAWKLLGKTKEVMDQLKIPFWICGGTLLGFFRQCDIIPWTTDVDIGVNIEDYKPNLIQGFTSKGFRHIYRFGRVNDSFELSFKQFGVKLDVFFFYHEGARMWQGAVKTQSGKKFKYYLPSITLCWAELLGLKVPVPCQTEEYIRTEYGPNWFNPAFIWDWVNTPNMVENGYWPKKLLKEVIFVRE